MTANSHPIKDQRPGPPACELEQVTTMTLARLTFIGVSVLILGATIHNVAGGFEFPFASMLASIGFSRLTDPTNLMALLVLGLWAFGGWIAAWKILKRKYSRSARQMENRFNQEIRLLDSAIDQHSIVSIADRDGTLIRVNKNFEEAFGYSGDDIIGKSVSILYDSPEAAPDSPRVLEKEDGHAPFADIHGAVRDGMVWSGEQSLRRANGDVIRVMSTVLPNFDDQGNHVQTVSLRTDITQQRVNEAQRQLTRLLDELQDEVFLYDVETLEISYMNKSALARCEWSAKDITSKTIADTSAGFSVPAFRAHVAPLMDGSRDVVSIETKHEKGPIEVSTRIYTGPSGNAVFLSVLRDTSERKKLQLVKMDTMALVSHELRTPLTSIKGALRLIQSGVAGDLTPEIQGMIDIASRNSDRLLLMVNDILVLEKMNANKVEFVMEETDLSALVRDAVSINQGFAEELGVRFVTDTAPHQPLITGNSERLMQVMTNLMSNAAKYSPKGGEVHVGVRDRGNSWQVYVTDNGPGVPENARATIFDSFTQFSAADGTSRSGTGLGLQICKKIVLRHKGRISYESEPGIETTFYFDLPKLAAPPQGTVIEFKRSSGKRGRHTSGTDTDMVRNG